MDKQNLDQNEPQSFTTQQIKKSANAGIYAGLAVIILGLLWALLAPQFYIQGRRLFATWPGTILIGAAITLVGYMARKGASARKMTTAILAVVFIGGIFVVAHAMVFYP